MNAAVQRIELIEPTDVMERHVETAANLPVATSATPADLVRMAVEQGADLDRLERLMGLQERWEANEARKAFTQSMTAFKAEPLTIFKKKSVGFTTKEGEFVGYKHAELSDVTDVVVPALARHGLSHRWDVKQENGRVGVTCVDGFQNAALEGTAALRAHYEKLQPDDAWWGRNSKALKDAAKKADEEVTR